MSIIKSTTPICTVLVLLFLTIAEPVLSSANLCRIDKATDQASLSAIKLPFVVLADSPLERLNEAARQSAIDTQNFLKISDSHKSSDPYSPDHMKVYKKMATQIFNNFKRDVTRVRDLYKATIELAPELKVVFESSLKRLNETLASLPDNVENHQLKGNYTHLNSIPLTWAKLYLSHKHFQGEFEKFIKTLDIAHYIRQVRPFSKVLASSKIQSLLQEVIVDGLEFEIKTAAARTQHPKGWSPSDTWYLTGLFTFTLPGYENIRSNFDVSSDHVTIQVNYHLLVNLVSELISNASRASMKRHSSITDPIQLRTTRVKLDKSGNARIEIEDFGYPDEYFQVQGVGSSHQEQNGLGIGRFRSYMLAQFMGYRIWHTAKPDGSGSIINIEIPKSHITN